MDFNEVASKLIREFNEANALTETGKHCLNKAIEWSQSSNIPKSMVKEMFDDAIKYRNTESAMSERYFMLSMAQLQIIYG